MGYFGKYLPILGRIFQTAVHWGCLGYCTFEFVGELVLCTGTSMEPTLYENDIIISDRMLRKLKRINHDDIVVAQSVADPKLLVCKRVTALEGDIVLYYNRFFIIPPGHAWLTGDNRNNSSDSRNYGPVPIALIRGRVICRIWPFSNTCLF